MKTDIVSWAREQWDRCAAWAAVAAGAILLVVGWVGVSGTQYTAKQIPYLASAGLGGLFLLGLGAMLWLSADLRDEWRKLDQIQETIREFGTLGLEHTRGEVVLPVDLRSERAPVEAHPAAHSGRAR